MAETNLTQIMQLKEKSLGELQAKHQELFPGQKVPSDNKVHLIRKIAFRVQELEHGGLSEETKARIAELIEKYDPINNKALRPQVVSGGKNVVAIPSLRDKRLPIPGTVIQKRYKGQEYLVKVLEKGFEYKDKFYKSLSAVAYEITGAHWNGYSFFGF
ncbi:MAG: DUF2924 domain-containing protein [Phycisphaerae bacterium]|nr:DUF2924 domain-containing protein [Phycisphaerae bacterium]